MTIKLAKFNGGPLLILAHFFRIQCTYFLTGPFVSKASSSGKGCYLAIICRSATWKWVLCFCLQYSKVQLWTFGFHERFLEVYVCLSNYPPEAQEYLSIQVQSSHFGQLISPFQVLYLLYQYCQILTEYYKERLIPQFYNLPPDILFI